MLHERKGHVLCDLENTANSNQIVHMGEGGHEERFDTVQQVTLKWNEQGYRAMGKSLFEGEYKNLVDIFDQLKLPRAREKCTHRNGSGGELNERVAVHGDTRGGAFHDSLDRSVRKRIKFVCGGQNEFPDIYDMRTSTSPSALSFTS